MSYETGLNFYGFPRRRQLDVAFVAAGILLGIALGWSSAEVSMFSLFLWSFLGPIPSRILAAPALFLLASVPVLLLAGQKTMAEDFSIYAYYFLVMAVIRGIVELREDECQGKKTRSNFS